MGTNDCGCGCDARKTTGGLIDRNVSLLIQAGAAVATNCERCLKSIIRDLAEAGVAEEQIRGAVQTGEMVKSRPAGVMKEAADAMVGTSLSEKAEEGPCPLEAMKKKGIDIRVPLLVAAGSAIAANCEPCLNTSVPRLYEAGVDEADVRRAIEIGQSVKDQAAAFTSQAADVFIGGKQMVETTGCCG